MKLMPRAVMTAALSIGLSGTVQAIAIQDIKINGFFDLEYEEADEVPGDTRGSFDVYHMNILAEYPVTDRFTIRHHLEYEHVPALKSGGGSGELKTEWSYVEYLHSNSLKLRAGFALTPFGIYNEIHDATPVYNSIRTPWEIYKTASTGAASALFPKFTTGIFALGNVETGGMEFDYAAYLGNGENDSKNEAERDENTNKAVGGRINFIPAPGILIGFSAFDGEVGAARADHSAWAISGEYWPLPLGVRAEIASAETGNITQQGSYIEASYQIGSFTPFVRLGSHDPDDSTDNDEWKAVIFGLVYKVNSQVALKLENRDYTGDSGNADVSNDYNEWAGAITVAF